MASTPILPIRRPVAFGTMIKFDGDGVGDSDGVGMCKQAFSSNLLGLCSVRVYDLLYLQSADTSLFSKFKPWLIPVYFPSFNPG